jgi:hypothetical protein
MSGDFGGVSANGFLGIFPTGGSLVKTGKSVTGRHKIPFEAVVLTLLNAWLVETFSAFCA